MPFGVAPSDGGAFGHNVDRSHISRTLPLALLAPDIVTAIIDGRTEPSLTLSRIKP